MKVLSNVELKKYTTVRIGGIAEKFIIPQNIEELTDVMRKDNPKYLIGGGSNLLISERTFDMVVCLREFADYVNDLGEGEFEVGASVRLQKLIMTINEKGYGGIEYLYSVPGLVGGAVVMNAGRGKSYNKTISDYIKKVTVLYEGKILEINKEDCGFEHRNSMFKNSEYIILSVIFNFPKQSVEVSKKLREERILLCKENQDSKGYNFGSVFMEANTKILRIFKKYGSKKNKHVYFSKKTLNWLINDGEGTFDEALRNIEMVNKVHKIFRKDCTPEVIIWK